jgi:hypothetical protein
VIALCAVLVAASLLVYLFRLDVEEPRRYLMALATLGFFFAPLSERPLRAGLWLSAVAAVAWGAQVAGSGRGGFPLWLACSVAGALLVVRGGSRAARYYLPEAGNEAGRSRQRRIRKELQVGVVLFLGGYLHLPPFSGLLVVLSAVFFVRYVLLQSKHLGVPAVPLPREEGVVPSQRWPVLLLFALISGTSLPGALLEGREESLLLTATLLLLSSALVFVLSLTRTGWSRSFIRRASFAAGVLLAVAVTAVLVELEAWDRTRFRVFASLCAAFLVVLPFVRERTKLFEPWPRLSALVPRASLAILMAPVTAMGGTKPFSPTALFLFAFSVLMLAYYLLVGLRARAKGNVYVSASLAVSLHSFFAGGGGRRFQVFLLALGFALYAVDRLERVWRESRDRERERGP